jgi:hypothetical protein
MSRNIKNIAFTNELNNDIIIKFKDHNENGVNYVTIKMIGPNSEAEWTITAMEAGLIKEFL